MQDFKRRLTAEFIGTFALVFIGGGAIVTNATVQGELGLLGIALAHAIVLLHYRGRYTATE